MEKMYAGVAVNVNEEGYLTDFSQWSKEVAEDIAKEENVSLTQRHWDLISYLQGEHKKESALSIRKVGKSGVVSIKEFYELFPTGPLKVSTRVAGIPKPASCI